MLARRLPSILPDMTRQEALETTRDLLRGGADAAQDHPLVTRAALPQPPPYRLPACPCPAAAPVPRPGEISLAHNGVLFLDELPEFHKDGAGGPAPAPGGRRGHHHPRRRQPDPARPVHAGVRHESLPVRLVRPPHPAGARCTARRGAAATCAASPAPCWTASTCTWRCRRWSTTAMRRQRSRRSPRQQIRSRVNAARAASSTGAMRAPADPPATPI